MEEFTTYENQNPKKTYFFINSISFIILNYFLYSFQNNFFSTIQKIIINIILLFVTKILFSNTRCKQIIKIYKKFGIEVVDFHLNKSVTKKFYHFDDIEECLIYEYIGVVSVHYKLGIKIWGYPNFIKGIKNDLDVDTLIDLKRCIIKNRTN